MTPFDLAAEIQMQTAAHLMLTRATENPTMTDTDKFNAGDALPPACGECGDGTLQSECDSLGGHSDLERAERARDDMRRALQMLQARGSLGCVDYRAPHTCATEGVANPCGPCVAKNLLAKSPIRHQRGPATSILTEAELRAALDRSTAALERITKALRAAEQERDAMRVRELLATAAASEMAKVSDAARAELADARRSEAALRLALRDASFALCVHRCPTGHPTRKHTDACVKRTRLLAGELEGAS